jgi:hypothetical protein
MRSGSSIYPSLLWPQRVLELAWRQRLWVEMAVVARLFSVPQPVVLEPWQVLMPLEAVVA